MPHPLMNPFDKRKPPTLTNAEAVGKVSDPSARQAMEELLSRKEDPIENTEYQMTDEERAAFEAEMNVKPFETEAQKKRKEYIAWAASFRKDEEWVDETFTFNSDGTVEVEGNLDAGQATAPFPKGLTRVDGFLDLSALTSAKGLVLPEKIGRSIFLNSLTSAEDLVLPQEIVSHLYLNSLTSAKGLVLPREVGGNLYLEGLTSAEDLILPEKVGGSLLLDSLTSAEGLVLPREIRRDLVLNGLTSAEGLVLPRKIYGDIYLTRIFSSKGLIIPEEFRRSLITKRLSESEASLLRQKYPEIRVVEL